MGSCVSVHKDPASAIKIRFSIHPKTLSIPSPVKEKTDPVNAGNRTVGDILLDSHSSPARFVDTDSKDDSFFDSQPWLESDCEDDFFSVNGDFTPSRGNTPVHHSFSPGNPRLSNARSIEGPTGSLPNQTPDKKKRLSELFKDSLRNVKYGAHNQSEVLAKGAPIVPETTSVVQSGNGAPLLSGANSIASSEVTASGELGEEKLLKSGQCCLPRLVSSLSFNERKKRMSPARKDV